MRRETRLSRLRAKHFGVLDFFEVILPSSIELQHVLMVLPQGLAVRDSEECDPYGWKERTKVGEH